jgi:two-component system KDP operon response regulator KdpE
MPKGADKKRLLIVDDDPRILRFTSIDLSLEGYEVTTAGGGEEALALVASEAPDVVLLDLLMAPMSGFDLLARLRTFSQVPVIIVTAHGFTTEQAVKLGANDLVAKPFRPSQLVARIERLLNGSGAAGDGEA